QMAPTDGKAMMVFTVTQGNSLTAAAQATNTELQLKQESSRQLTVNGLPALEVLTSQTSQDPNSGATSSIAVQSVYIQYSNDIYVFHGVSTPQNFGSYDGNFDRTMSGFKALTDASKINVKPERIKLVAVKSSGTLSQALQANGVTAARVKEFAIVNGLETNAQVKAGTMIKVPTK
ncbi:MAG: peptidase M48, partial [Bacteroidota bacterium]|nr:peptidase M48 [Bacteroidota bacterium]